MSMDNGPVAFRFKPAPNPPELALRKAQDLRPPARCEMTSRNLVQHHKPITISNGNACLRLKAGDYVDSARAS